MKFKVITAVGTEPITRAEAKLHLGLDDMSGSHPDDAIIDALITGARQHAEHYTKRALAQQTVEAALDAFPDSDDDRIDLPRAPVASITSVKYTDTSGTEQTISGSAYALSTYGESRTVAPTVSATLRDRPSSTSASSVSPTRTPSLSASRSVMTRPMPSSVVAWLFASTTR